MAIYIARLSDFANMPMDAVAPKVVFTASNAAVDGSSLYATRRIEAVAVDDIVTVDLVPVAGLYPSDVYLTMRIEWLDALGGMSAADFPQWKFYPSSEGGTFSDMIQNAPAPDPTPDGMVLAPTGFTWADSPLAGRLFKSAGQFVTTLDVADYKLTGGKTYWVDVVNGLDTNAGTQALPYKTIKKAHDQTDAQTAMVRATGLYTRANGMYGISITKSLNIIGWDGTPIITASDALTWTLTATKTNTYQATRSGVDRVIDVQTGVNGVDYVQRFSINDVEANPGSYFADTSIVYVHTPDSRVADANVFALLGVALFRVTTDLNLYMENLVCLGGTACVSVNTPVAGVGPKLYMKDVRSGFSTTLDAVTFGGSLSIFQDCEAFNSVSDGFNYTATNGIAPKSVELRCRGYSNGTAGANQGSTAHDGSKVIRVNGQYFDNLSSNIADVGAGTETWNLGCAAYASQTEYDWYFTTSTPAIWLDSCVGFISSVGLQVGPSAVVKVRNSAFSSIVGTVTTY